MILVIGYGNPLRADDGVGWAVADAVHRARPDATVITAHQLLPELAADLADAAGVIFVDARVGDVPGRLRCEPLPQHAPGRSFPPGHVLTATGLLDLTFQIYGRRPDAFIVSVGAEDFSFRTDLSPAVAQAVQAAVDTVLGIVDALTSANTTAAATTADAH